MKMKMKMKNLKTTTDPLTAPEGDWSFEQFKGQVMDELAKRWKNKFKVEALFYDKEENRIEINASSPEETAKLFEDDSGWVTIFKLPKLDLPHEQLKGILDKETKSFKLRNIYNNSEKEIIDEYINKTQQDLQAKNGAKSWLQLVVYPDKIEPTKNSYVLEEKVLYPEVDVATVMEPEGDDPEGKRLEKLLGGKYNVKKKEGTPELSIKTFIVSDANIEMEKTVDGAVILNINDVRNLTKIASRFASNGNKFLKNVGLDLGISTQTREIRCEELSNKKKTLQISFDKLKRALSSLDLSDTILGVSITDKYDREICNGLINRVNNEKVKNSLTLELDELVELAVDELKERGCFIYFFSYSRENNQPQ
jgi:hypothetical protein